MENVPNGLIAAVAQNILAKKKGERALATFYKEASTELASPNQNAEFLSQYGFTPGDFVGDRTADRAVTPIERKTKGQVKGYFKSQAELMGGMTPELARNQSLALRNLAREAGQARVDTSIRTTRAAAEAQPEIFGQMVDLSNRSRAAFEKSKIADVATVGGGLAGLAGGAMFGKRPVVKAGLSALGALGGGLSGFIGGRAAEEARTGYSHGDVLKPYEVADRMRLRHKTDSKA